KDKPVLVWTADRIKKEAPDIPLFFAVDHESLAEVLRREGYDAVMTDPSHTCGTDRIAEANRRLKAAYVINVQADEPLVTGDQIRQLVALIQQDTDMATLGTPLRYDKDYHNPNHVKLVCDDNGYAIYFSRAPIPYMRDTHGAFDVTLAAAVPVLIHLGLYAYTASFLERFCTLPPGKLEQVEKLEMLRAMERGHRIRVGITKDALIEIDTPEQAVEFEQVVTERFPFR
ncbi:MAG TPA: 3-deoxy-manno-octulosonate cytidylyltransferase, partial [Nitrospira sp.]|nr:3-deoxy-manno-octulosonate cytidylyltransferase [Nitrospira sp.]